MNINVNMTRLEQINYSHKAVTNSYDKSNYC